MGTVRRHGAALDAAINDAVLAVVAAHGAAGVTMEAVAAAAQTSKPVLYRRWPDGPALLREVLLRIVVANPATGADTGSYRTDMLTALGGWIALFTGHRGMAMRAVIATMTHDTDLALAVRGGVVDWRKKEMAAVLSRGIARGDVRADVPIDLVSELAQSVLFHHLLISGDPITDHLVIRLVDEVLVPLVAPEPRGPVERRRVRA